MIDPAPASYVYRILVDGVPRYIGKGTGWRLPGHLAVLTGRKPRERIHGLMIEAAAAGAVVTGDKVAEGLTHHQAQNLEREMVAAATGLWNLAPGGGGFNSRMAAKGWADPEKAAAYGITNDQLRKTLEMSFGGYDAAQIQSTGNSYNVIVEFDRSKPWTENSLHDINILSTKTNTLVPLSNFATVESKPAPVAINQTTSNAHNLQIVSSHAPASGACDPDPHASRPGPDRRRLPQRCEWELECAHHLGNL